MKIRKLNQRGFSHFEAIVLIVVLVVIGSVGTFVYSRMHKSHAGSQEFSIPDAISSDNLGHIWVANYGDNSVTELNAKDGILIKVINGAAPKQGAVSSLR